MSTSDDIPPLYRTDTRLAAGFRAGFSVTSRRRKILEFLDGRGGHGAAIFEVADHLGVFDHQISGRFGELERDRWIEKTGQRKVKPATGCEAELYRIRRAEPSRSDPAADAGYAFRLKIGDELFDRQELLRGGDTESYPGMPYARSTDTGALRQVVRVELVECPGCGRPLMRIDEAGVVKLRCNNIRCHATSWRLRAVAAVGQAPLLALVMEDFK